MSFFIPQSKGIEIRSANKSVNKFANKNINSTFAYMIKLKESTKKQIRSDVGLFFKSCEALDVKNDTLYRYLRDDSSRLTEIDFLNTITEHTNLPLSELIEGGKVNKLLAR